MSSPFRQIPLDIQKPFLFNLKLTLNADFSFNSFLFWRVDFIPEELFFSSFLRSINESVGEVLQLCPPTPIQKLLAEAADPNLHSLQGAPERAALTRPPTGPTFGDPNRSIHSQ